MPVEYGEHYTTAYDIALMSRELVKYDQVLEWASIWVDYVQLPGREAMLVNTNKMINSYPGMDGLKPVIPRKQDTVLVLQLNGMVCG